MKRLLFIAHRVPYPPDKGERVRAFHEIKALSAHFRVTLAALAHTRADEKSAEAMEDFCEKVLTARAGGWRGLARGAWTLLTGRSVTEGYFKSRRLGKILAAEAADEPFDVVVGYSSSTLSLVAQVPARARVLDMIDVDSRKWRDYADASAWPKRWLYLAEARGVRRLERRAGQVCDAVCVVSAAEARAMGEHSEKLLPVTNGVNSAYFRPPATPEPIDDATPSLVFTGTMSYRPNVEGVCWFAEEVLPALRRRWGGLVFCIVGRDPAPAVRKLAQLDGVEVTGSVGDVRPYLSGALAAVVPLRIARGIQNKVLEAMAMGKAVIASPEALEGLDVQVGTEVLGAAAPQQWVDAVAELLDHPGRREQIAGAARSVVVEKYGWADRLAPLVGLCRRLAGDPDAAESIALAAEAAEPDEKRR